MQHHAPDDQNRATADERYLIPLCTSISYFITLVHVTISFDRRHKKNNTVHQLPSAIYFMSSVAFVIQLFTRCDPFCLILSRVRVPPRSIQSYVSTNASCLQMEHETWLTAFGIHLFCQSFVKLTIVCLITGVLHMNVFHFAKFEIKLIDTIQCIVCSGAPPRDRTRSIPFRQTICKVMETDWMSGMVANTQKRKAIKQNSIPYYGTLGRQTNIRLNQFNNLISQSVHRYTQTHTHTSEQDPKMQVASFVLQ